MEEKKKQARYGNDKFNRFLLLLSVLFISLMLLHERFWLILAISTMLFAYVRIFSRNIEQRKAENDAFMRIFSKKKPDLATENPSNNSDTAQNPQNEALILICACPNCQSQLSIPKEHINLRIKCPNCEHCFTYQQNSN